MGAGAWSRHGALESGPRPLQNAERAGVCGELEVPQYIGETSLAIKLPGCVRLALHLWRGEHHCVLWCSLQQVVQDFGTDALTLRRWQNMYLGKFCVGVENVGDIRARMSGES